MIKEILKSFIIGALFIFVFNFLFRNNNFYIPFNIFSSLVIGFFRIPGIIMVIIILLI